MLLAGSMIKDMIPLQI